MSSAGDGDDLGRLVADLVSTLREIEAEFEPRTRGGLPRPPTPREVVRFTSEVGIPAAILVLRTNVEALRLLRRALRMADGRSPTSGGEVSQLRERAERVSRETLSRLDAALADLQAAVEGRPEDEQARTLLAEARDLRERVEASLASGQPDTHEGSKSTYRGTDVTESGGESGDGDDVPVDVDAEMQSLRDEFDDGPDGDDAKE